MTDHPDIPMLAIPPGYCEYAKGPCDQDFSKLEQAAGLFLYSSHATQISGTIDGAVSLLRERSPTSIWRTWREFQVAGLVIYCEICKGMRGSECVIADVTTMNFNLMFEIGFAIGLGQPVLPIRDTSLVRDEARFRDLGLLDTIGYLDFQNSDTLATGILEHLPRRPLPPVRSGLKLEAPVYVVKANHPTEGDVRLMSALSQSALNCRSLDPVETPRVSLHEVRREISASLGVVVHLMSAGRAGAEVHNARCALLAGISMATGKSLLMLQEDVVQQPIDYRDLVASYTTPHHVTRIVNDYIKEVIQLLQEPAVTQGASTTRFLERLEIGDIAAENESTALRNYFVRTAQFNEARRGAARLVIGRKGSGKTALFFGVRDAVPRSHKHLVLDLKPEGHQFTKLREVVLSRLSWGLQEHTLVAFWNYILLCEMAHFIREHDYSWAQRDPDRWVLFESITAIYNTQASVAGDFSERLLHQVDRLVERFVEGEQEPTGGQLTEMLFRGDIRQLDDVLAPYLSQKESVWVLVDNLDKGWPTRGARSTDILILRALLEASRKLQYQFEERAVALHCMLFLRNDIYDHLLNETPDRGKDTPVSVDWDDVEAFKELLRRRICSTGELDGTFDEVWSRVMSPYVGTVTSFNYLTSRTLMRPRDLLGFLRRVIGVAINRGHDRATEEDILKAEEGYSEDILLNTAFELGDVFPEMTDVLYMFMGVNSRLTENEVLGMIRESAGPDGPVEELLENLLWFGFIGVRHTGAKVPVFAYQVRYNVEKLRTPVRRGLALFEVHPAYHKALGIGENPRP